MKQQARDLEILYGAGRIFLFFYIVSYFFKIVKSGTYATLSRSARSVKKLPYVGPIGDTGCVGRFREKLGHMIGR